MNIHIDITSCILSIAYGLLPIVLHIAAACCTHAAESKLPSLEPLEHFKCPALLKQGCWGEAWHTNFRNQSKM